MSCSVPHRTHADFPVYVCIHHVTIAATRRFEGLTLNREPLAEARCFNCSKKGTRCGVILWKQLLSVRIILRLLLVLSARCKHAKESHGCKSRTQVFEYYENVVEAAEDAKKESEQEFFAVCCEALIDFAAHVLRAPSQSDSARK